MIIISLDNCGDCKRYKNLHPEFKYITLDKLTNEEKAKIKISLESLNWNKKVPCLVNEHFSQLIPREKLIQELRIRTHQTKPCHHCGG